MATRSKSPEAKKETIVESAFFMGLAIAVLVGLVWFLASHKIVYSSTPGLRWLGVPWYLFSQEKWAAINEAYVVFRNAPRSIPLQNFVAFANACLMPLAVLCSLASVASVIWRLVKKSGGSSLRRKMDPMTAAKEIAKVFPAIVPVLHLGPDLVKNKLPLWRRQTFPEDVWQKEKVNGRPLAAGNKLFLDRTDSYFRGGEVKDGPHQLRNGRRWSKMLGFQVVDLMADVGKHSTICFPDRFSSAGKVLFAILCAHAFGGREGKLDYEKACSQLNLTCAGQANGLPNLKVAQWIYTKYRMHPDAKMLFAIHHWEFTYLYSLFFKAKVSGKATHTDFIWLKPLDRVLFYTLNTVGRAVPHTESGSVFAQFDYETKCAMYERLPLRIRADGSMESHICIHTALEGFGKEFNRFMAGTDDDEGWWKNVKTWSAAAQLAAQAKAMKEELDAQKASLRQIASLPVQPDTPFDTAMNAERKQRDEAEALRIAEALTGGHGSTGSAAGKGAGGSDLDMF